MVLKWSSITLDQSLTLKKSVIAVVEQKADIWAPPLPQHPLVPDFFFTVRNSSLLQHRTEIKTPFASPLQPSTLIPRHFHAEKIESLMQKAVIPGGGVISGGSMSTFSEESSSYPDGSELELGLGLSLGGGGKAKSKTPSVAAAGGSLDQVARILTAEDFPSVLSDKSSSSSSSTIKAKNNGCCGSKRTAEPSSPPGCSGVSQVVGWPPIRAYRMNSLVNHSRIPAVEEFTSTIDKYKNENKNISLENRLPRTSFFIKVNMEGIPIGRKVDLNAHSCYETLARKLDDMFGPDAAFGPRRSSLEEQAVMTGTRCPVRLLDDSSEFVLIYEDKEGDWMLVGDVPWQMFLSTVRRLKIMKTSEAN